MANYKVITARALTGITLSGIAAGLVFFAWRGSLPEIVRDPVQVTVDKRASGERHVVCPGGFAASGLDPANPETATLLGESTRETAGKAFEQQNFGENSGLGIALDLVARAKTPLAAASLQNISGEGVRGAVAQNCGEALNEQWLVGGQTTVGVSTSVRLTNPTDVSATVQLHIYGAATGEHPLSTRAVLVQPRSEALVSLNGYAPDREILAVRVVSTGAPVLAGLAVTHEDAITPFAVATVKRQLTPEKTLVFAGIANVTDHRTGASDVLDADVYSVQVAVLAPEGANATAALYALDEGGNRFDLGVIELQGNTVSQLALRKWPKQAHALLVEASVPVVAGVLASANEAGQHDYSWFAPAPALPEGEPLAAPVVPSGQAFFVNSGAEDVTVQIVGAAGEKSSVRIPAGAVIPAALPPGGSQMQADGIFHAGVLVLDGANISSYPLLAPLAFDSNVSVYTR